MNLSSIPVSHSALFRTLAAAAGEPSAWRWCRVSPENFAITSAAATPLPETSPSAMPRRLPGNGTKS